MLCFVRFLLILILTSSCFQALANNFKKFADEITSPITTKAKYFLLSGSLLTLTFSIDGVEDSLGHRVQDDTVEDRPLGKFSELGDLAGQMLPNALYSITLLSMYHFSKDPDQKSKSVQMFKATLYTGLTTTVLKSIVREPRPNSDNRDSFPSGHTASAFAFASTVGAEHKWYWGLAAYTMASFVAYSRINDNAHRLHDVAGGATLGISYGLGLHYLKLKKRASNFNFIPSQDGFKVVYGTQF